MVLADILLICLRLFSCTSSRVSFPHIRHIVPPIVEAETWQRYHIVSNRSQVHKYVVVELQTALEDRFTCNAGSARVLNASISISYEINEQHHLHRRKRGRSNVQMALIQGLTGMLQGSLWDGYIGQSLVISGQTCPCLHFSLVLVAQKKSFYFQKQHLMFLPTFYTLYTLFVYICVQ